MRLAGRKVTEGERGQTGDHTWVNLRVCESWKQRRPVGKPQIEDYPRKRLPEAALPGWTPTLEQPRTFVELKQTQKCAHIKNKQVVANGKSKSRNEALAHYRRRTLTLMEMS